MKDNLTENKEQPTAVAAEAEKNGEVAAGLQKFKDVQTLIDAYQALEAEFTRRSQRLRELEANKEKEAPVQTENAQAPSPIAEATADSCLRQLTREEKNAVIEEYLNGVCANRGVPFVTGGGAVRAARNTPGTLKEAAVLARSFFDNKED